ncbi:MAG: penicillin-binding protein activator [Alphaproteobacteria bacterium]
MRILQTRLFFSFKNLFFLIIPLFVLAGCSSSGGHNAEPWKVGSTNQRPAVETPSDLSVATVEQQNLDAPALRQNGSTVKVAILLPLSGQHAKLGENMLNAAQIALFDIGFDQFELLPKDTKGTPQGAKEAAKEALKDNAQLVLGPVFSHSVRAARQVTQSAGINMIAFSTDWTLANKHTFLIGFLPFDQIDRVVRYAAGAGYGRIGALSPRDNYGDAVMSAYNASAQSLGIQTTKAERISPKGKGLTPIMRAFSNYDARKNQPQNTMRQNLPFDAVLMPVGGSTARQIGSFLNHYDLPPRAVRRLGTGLMDDQLLAKDKTLEGTWFAAPSPNTRAKFERRYQLTFGGKPARIASLAYDATALAAILGRLGLEKGGIPAYDYTSITNPNGFAGVDGIFRFRQDGISERGLAVLEYRKGQIIVVDRAPRTFQNRGY